MTSVAVIIPSAGKRPEMLAEALASLDTQTVKPDEVIVMKGKGDAWERVNKGVKKSKTDTFIVLCDDDMLEPTYIEKTVEAMERYGVDIVSTPLRNIGDDTGVHAPDKHPFVTSLISRRIFDIVGGYDVKAGLAADADFYYGCFEQGARWEKLGDPLFLYRVHGKQWSKNDEWPPYMEYIHKKHGL
jgi:glycosyltransferase involved in cell wall biosynthesis